MPEGINIDNSLDKERKYQLLIPQIFALIHGENDVIANMANICAALKYGMDFFWVGFYLIGPGKSDEHELILGPFQGPVACTRIRFGKGVCGLSWKEKRVVVVNNVDEFPGHIACNEASKSEIVLPVYNSKQEIFAILDVDSDRLAAFDEIDVKYLGELAKAIEEKMLKV